MNASILKNLFIAVIIMACSGISAQNFLPELDPSSLDTGTRSYDVVRNGQVISEMSITLSRQDLAGQDAYFSRRRIETPLGTLEQDVVFDARTLEPIGAEGESQSRFKVDYIYHKGRVIGTVTTPDSIVKRINRNMKPGTLFPWMYEYVIALVELDSGKLLQTPVLHTDANATYTIEAEVAGDTTINVPAGTFDAYVLRIKGNSPSTMYVRKEQPHIAIKQTVDHMPVSIELKAYPDPERTSTTSTD